MKGLQRLAPMAVLFALALALTGCISVIGGRHHGLPRDNGGLTVETGREVVVHCLSGSVAGRVEKTQADWLVIRDASGAESWVRMSDITRIDYR